MPLVKFISATEDAIAAHAITEGYLYFATDRNILAYDMNGQRKWISDDSVLYNTTSGWKGQTSFIPRAGQIVIYSDYYTDLDGNSVPGIKIGDGKAYGVDLPFITKNYDALIEQVDAHIKNNDIHFTVGEKAFIYNTAIGCDYKEDTLILQTLLNLKA